MEAVRMQTLDVDVAAENIHVRMREHLLLTRMRVHASRLLLLLVASYGLFYFAYKFERPWPGSNAYSDYYNNYYFMYLSPLNLHVASAPFVCRQISAVLTHLVLRSHIYFGSLNNIAPSVPGFDLHVLFAAMFTNWIFLVLAAWLAGLIAEQALGEKNAVAALIAGFLCLLAFQTQYYVISGLTEGVSWFLLAAGFLAYMRKARRPLLLVLVLSVFQRETIIVALGLIAAFDLVLTGKERNFRVQVCAGAVLCFVGYFLARRLFIPGFDHQTQLSAMASFVKHMRLSKYLFSQTVLNQNIMLIFLGMALLGIRKGDGLNRVWVPVLLSMVGIDFLGLAVGVEDVGRIAAILVPVLAALAASGFWRQRYQFQ